MNHRVITTILISGIVAALLLAIRFLNSTYKIKPVLPAAGFSPEQSNLIGMKKFNLLWAGIEAEISSVVMPEEKKTLCEDAKTAATTILKSHPIWLEIANLLISEVESTITS